MDLILHLQGKEISFGTGPKSPPPQDRLMPTEYFGLTSDQAPTTVAPSTPKVDPMAAVVAAREAAARQQVASNGSPLYTRAVELAKAAPDYATFLGQALADNEILADEELAVQCADESQLWASVH
jgi:hypothetical protein